MTPVAQYLAALSPRSRETQIYGLRRALRALDLDDFDVLGFDWSRMLPEHVELVKARLDLVCAPATVRLTLCALRRVLSLCKRTHERSPAPPPLGREPTAPTQGS